MSLHAFNIIICNDTHIWARTCPYALILPSKWAPVLRDTDNFPNLHHRAYVYTAGGAVGTHPGRPMHLNTLNTVTNMLCIISQHVVEKACRTSRGSCFIYGVAVVSSHCMRPASTTSTGPLLGTSDLAGRLPAAIYTVPTWPHITPEDEDTRILCTLQWFWS